MTIMKQDLDFLAVCVMNCLNHSMYGYHNTICHKYIRYAMSKKDYITKSIKDCFFIKEYGKINVNKVFFSFSSSSEDNKINQFEQYKQHIQINQLKQ